ncbi:hypothetical protein FHV99_004680 [Ochrobactrum sp. P20RRXII]|nr:hypothetical protein [Ochrobactrum sp. P20RRXII]NIH77428.1 hypothetical protein [Ochrobactrum sp. P20RRXII]
MAKQSKELVFDVDDAINTSFPNIRVKIKDKEHQLLEATVGSFIENVRDMEALRRTSDIVEELEILMRIIIRAFPTIKREDLSPLTLTQLNELANFGRRANEEITDEDLEGDGAAEPGKLQAAE